MNGHDAPRNITRLPETLSNQIAAGEVVERPASVIKELCENAVDAGAASINVEIEGGGVTLCQVADDGWGMDRDDAILSLERHATSKIARIEDLDLLNSFGFRGEALPSIASVSKLRLETRRRGEEVGTQVEIEGGSSARIAPFGGPTGTRVSIRELFFNVPARRKFLRAFATESAHVTEVVENVAIASPSLTVTLTRDGRKVREFLRASNFEERVADLLTGWELLRVDGQRGPLGLQAFLSRPEKARRGATGLRLFVNGRPIRDRALARAVAFGYGSLLDGGAYPVGVVYLSLPPALVDVNVHPQKAEVRFADGRAVLSAATRMVQEGLLPLLGGQVSMRLPSVTAGGQAGDRLALSTREATDPQRVIWSGSGELLATNLPLPAAQPVPYPTREEGALPTDEPSLVAGARYLSQLAGMFLLCETDDALLVIDQHAAAERVTFDRLRRSLFEGRSLASQALLTPEVVELDAESVALVEASQAEIGRLGMDLRAAGPNSVAVFAVPQLLSRAAPAELCKSLIGELSRSSGRDFSGAIDLALATLACHGSLRAGERISEGEARELVSALARTDLGGYCPHGRPVVVRMSLRELEAKVGRR